MYYKKMTSNSINSPGQEPESESNSASGHTEGGNEFSGSTKGLSGQVIGGRYKIEETIKDSRHTSVYKARHLLLDKPVAIKVMFLKLKDNENMFLRFKREAKLAAELSHVNICTMQDYWISEEGFPFIVTEFISGKRVTDLVKAAGGKLDEELAAAIVLQLCAALIHAHRTGIIHRDISPQNIMIDGGTVKLIDFGMAKSLYDTDSNLSMENTVYGTPTFMSPEQCMRKELDHRSDIYSLGCVFYMMLTGLPPFREQGLIDLVRAHISREPPVETEVKDPRLIPILKKMLAKNPDDRYFSASKLQSELEAQGFKAQISRT